MEKEIVSKTQETIIALIDQKLNFISEKVDAIDKKVTGEFLTKVEFEAKFLPVKLIAFGLAAVLMTGVITIILYTIFQKG
jgi:hypothetical protein